MPKGTKKKLPPSRIKYEQSHPTVTCRVSREVYDRLIEARETDGLSFADILRIGLDKQEVQRKNSEVKSMTDYSEGYEQAKLDYMVTYHCSVCGKIIEVENKEIKRVISKYLTEEGWGHKRCIE